MTLLVALLGILIAVVAVAVAVAPGPLIRVAHSAWRSPRTLYVAIACRLLVASVLLLAASRCRYPRLIGILGIVFLLRGCLLWMLGVTRVQAVLDWWAERSLWLVRGVAVLGIALGGFLTYAAIGTW